MKALIIGGGPAGTSSALAFLKNGWDVTLLEQRTQWKGRVCGAFLNPEAVSHLSWLGLKEETQTNTDISPVKQCWLTTDFGSESYVSILNDGNTGLAYPRNSFEDKLLDAVKQKGGKVLMGRRATRIKRIENKMIIESIVLGENLKQEFETDVVVAADGRFSVGSIPTKPLLSGWFGWNARFSDIEQQPGDLSLHFYPGGYVGLLTFADGSTNVSGLVYRQTKEPVSWVTVLDEAREKQPTLAKVLKNAKRISEWKGVGPLPYSKKMKVSNALVLAGDAAAVGDPFLGEGIGRGLGAGPLIDHCLKLNPSFDLDRFLMDYQNLWKKVYQSRLYFGVFAREAIKNKILYKPVLASLAGNKNLAQIITSTFHRGAAHVR